MKWTAMNVTSAETWMNFNQVLQIEDTMKIVFICLICKCMKVYIAPWKLERLIAQ